LKFEIHYKLNFAAIKCKIRIEAYMKKQILNPERIGQLIDLVLSDVNTGSIHSEPIVMESIQFDRLEVYDATNQNCWSFRSKGDTRNGVELNLGNMVSGYPYVCLGHSFQDSECAYIAGCYSLEGEVYAQIQQSLTYYPGGGYSAKGHFRKAKNDTTKLIRSDWEVINFQWMLLVLWEKTKNNQAFKNLLLSIPADAHIIEDTSAFHTYTSNVWGAKNPILSNLRKGKSNQIVEMLMSEGVTTIKLLDQYAKIVRNRINTYGVWTGKNATGKALKLCQLALLNNIEPPIDYDLLNQANIYWFGKKLEF